MRVKKNKIKKEFGHEHADALLAHEDYCTEVTQNTETADPSRGLGQVTKHQIKKKRHARVYFTYREKRGKAHQQNVDEPWLSTFILYDSDARKALKSAEAPLELPSSPIVFKRSTRAISIS